jgi:hypothetical protein
MIARPKVVIAPENIGGHLPIEIAPAKEIAEVRCGALVFAYSEVGHVLLALSV